MNKSALLNFITVFTFSLFFASREFAVRPMAKVRLSPAFNFKFQKPIFMQEFPIKLMGKRIFLVIEKSGRLLLAQHKNEGNWRKVIYDMRKRVLTRGWEEGLLGLAIDPEYFKNHRVYVYYSKNRPRRTVLSRLTIAPRGKVEKASSWKIHFDVSEEVILQIRQPFSNHNGGMLAFGTDGYLYVGVGDGGSAGDPYGHSQNIQTLLGAILRIDVSSSKKYKIPTDNPFSRKKYGKKEIYAYGLRNPWRFSIDAKSGQLLVGDVGQNLYEEISIIKNGGNYGWNIMEGFSCYKPKKNCKTKKLVKPILDYGHEEGSSILGGYIYHGKIKWLQGKYIFGDSMSGTVWFMDWKKPQKGKTFLIDTPFLLSSFAVDTRNELYLLDLNSGKIFQMFEN